MLFLLLTLQTMTMFLKDNFYNCNFGYVVNKNIQTNNIFVEGAWPEAAQKIIDNSGIIK